MSNESCDSPGTLKQWKNFSRNANELDLKDITYVANRITKINP